ncbi:ABC transporter substrate-binding protein [Candidatus Puniceispirillum sp.]|jgi:phospholipid transport system substrate-binding protein|uniref:MlaC/ttg2D family ABC transporter substrate-binding protein n=1 Tax=Candidatus Puniceispirillum sp. TaxID=2026719 RepID=UPI001ED44980|nr:ABC transporter substrate-binding protein [Candidatus Puniceispirillum sp.]MBT6565769.1 ABC transporter substrate-binding protein [Candidatus Puniceispirillum sp.]
MTRRFFSRIFVIFAVFFAMSASAFADNQVGKAEAHIDNMMLDLQGFLDNDSDDIEKRKKNVTYLLDAYFDLPLIARFSAGAYWRKATPTERQTYTDIMRQVMIGTVVRNFDQLSGLEYTAAKSTAKGKKLVLVGGIFTDKAKTKEPVAISWRVTTPEDGAARVMDVEIENISMLVTQKNENIAIIRKNQGNFSALIDTMRSKINE